METYKGACHCRAIVYEAELDLSKAAMECNCSHCSAKGFLLSFTPKSSFRLISGEKMLTEYRFYHKVLSHLFCKVCGVQCFAYGTMPDGTETVAVNIRTLENIDISRISKYQVDGKSF